jgi:hypothetical protein
MVEVSDGNVIWLGNKRLNDPRESDTIGPTRNADQNRDAVKRFNRPDTLKLFDNIQFRLLSGKRNLDCFISGVFTNELFRF